MKNVGTLDAKLRYGVGIVFITISAILLWLQLPFAIGSFAAGVALIFTARMRFCGLYKVLGYNSCPLDERK
jgi:hypothetical protein